MVCFATFSHFSNFSLFKCNLQFNLVLFCRNFMFYTLQPTCSRQPTRSSMSISFALFMKISYFFSCLNMKRKVCKNVQNITNIYLYTIGPGCSEELIPFQSGSFCCIFSLNQMTCVKNTKVIQLLKKIFSFALEKSC